MESTQGKARKQTIKQGQAHNTGIILCKVVLMY